MFGKNTAGINESLENGLEQKIINLKVYIKEAFDNILFQERLPSNFLLVFEAIVDNVLKALTEIVELPNFNLAEFYKDYGWKLAEIVQKGCEFIEKVPTYMNISETREKNFSEQLDKIKKLLGDYYIDYVEENKFE